MISELTFDFFWHEQKLIKNQLKLVILLS